VLRKLLQRLYFNKDLGVLLSGTLIAQAIPVLVSPMLTRLYTPENFAGLAILMAWFNPLSYLASGRFEIAVLLPKEDEEAKKLVRVSSLWSIGIALLLLIICILYFVFHTQPYALIPYKSVFITLPFLILFVGNFQPINYWLQRKKQFKAIAINKIIQTTIVIAMTVLFAFFYPNAGLTLGYTFGWLAMAILSISYLLKDKIIPFQFNWKEIITLAKKYKEYPIFNGLPSILNAITLSIPVFIIAYYYGKENTGYFNLTRQILFVPTSVIATSFSQVFFERIVSHKNKGMSVLDDYKKMINVLAIIALSFTIPLLIGGPFLFALVFGKTWAVSGSFAQIIVLSTALQFVVLPLGAVLQTFNKVKLNGLWQIMYFFAVISLIFAVKLDLNNFLRLFTFIELLTFSVLFYLVHLTVKNYEKQLIQG
jgi:O-antigen/teichoic acid export membrane protein